jgi:hypothetical protein
LLNLLTPLRWQRLLLYSLFVGAAFAWLFPLYLISGIPIKLPEFPKLHTLAQAANANQPKQLPNSDRHAGVC